MNVHEQDNKPACVPFIAAIDAKHRNQQNVGYWTSKQISTAEKFKLFLESVYTCNDVYINYRKKFIAIKIDNPVSQSEFRELLLNDIIEEKGFTKVVTPQGFILRLFEK